MFVKINFKKKKRLGRGGKKGNTCGKGNKGQKSRSGYSSKNFEGGQTPIYKKTPKSGFSKKPDLCKSNFFFKKKIYKNDKLFSKLFLLSRRIFSFRSSYSDDSILKIEFSCGYVSF
ncbi:hypothetical protein [Candidatus Vidania fulgoroideorum]